MRQLALLIDQVTLGDQQNAVAVGDGFHRLLCVRQQLNRVLQHLLPGIDQLTQDSTWHPVFGDLKGCFDHRQHKAFHAEPIVPQIAPLSRQQPVTQVIRVGMIAQQIGESLLRDPKEPFVVPKRIIGIETNCCEFLCQNSPPISYQLRVCALLTSFLTYNTGYIDRSKRSSLKPKTLLMIDCAVMTTVMTSDNDDDFGGDSSVALQTKPKTKRPPLYKVMLLNDDYTPMEFVVHILERFFGMTHSQAFEIMLTVHKKGVAVVGVFSHEIAETKVTQVMDFARRHQHPLQCTMEKE